MRRQGITRGELARLVAAKTGQEASNTVRPALSRHLNRRVAATPEIIERYADAIGVSVEAITVEPDPVAEAELEALRRRHAREMSRLREKQTARRAQIGEAA